MEKLKILKIQGLTSNECIPEQDFVSIRVLKDILEYARVRGSSVLRAHRRETRLTVYSAHSSIHDFCHQKVLIKLKSKVILSC